MMHPTEFLQITQAENSAVSAAGRLRRALMMIVLTAVLAGCATMPGWIPTSGASREQVLDVQEAAGGIEGVELVNVDDALAKKLAASKKLASFSDVFPGGVPNNYVVRPGDVLEVSVWEAPPAMLFGAITLDPQIGPATTNAITFPEQMVGPDGMISMPFAGRIAVRGRRTIDIESAIVKRLQGKANNPQVLVRIAQNNTSNVTVVGEVSQSTQMPLTPKGERLLDALAAGGGVKQSVNRVAIQLSRDDITATMALDSIIRDPKQNIGLKPGDVVTALFQSQSFSVLGATGKNEEIQFEAQVFHWCRPWRAPEAWSTTVPMHVEYSSFASRNLNWWTVIRLMGSAVQGPVPVVYLVDLRDPKSFFVTQNFPIQNGDVIYVSNAPAAEFQKFLRLVVSVAVPSVTLNNAVQ